ncbi:undecaprenyl-phosphate glucose phosphotransferase [Prevotella dentasini]|uniref:undecaprenyl-phosphate glucose phosphotransferase n=1 Tax=Prevotella dentasini TaxID=589537 RepID=UPI00046AA682|nr:undecaprenyl-phosphate glucose phosphotransferase [Prevotella dentasini]
MRKHNGNEIIQWLVVFLDFVILNAILLLLVLSFWDWVPCIVYEETKLFFFVANCAMVIAQYFFSTVIHLRYSSIVDVVKQTLSLVGMQVGMAFVLFRLIRNTGGLFHFALVFFCILFAVTLFSRVLELFMLRRYRQRGGNTRVVIFVGNDPALLTVYHELSENPATGYKVRGYYSAHTLDGAPEKLVRLGSIADLDELMKEEEENTSIDDRRIADELFCCMSHGDSEEIVRIMKFCDKHVIHFYYVPRMFGNYRLNLTAERVGSLDLFTNHTEPLQDISKRFQKRLFDILVSGIILLCMLPFIPIIALIIKIQSPGPIFFRQKRTGMNGETFYCLKFRSMHVNKDADKMQATRNDPRKFPFGELMRKTNIDEFPQFLNVLKGDMSIVGPRPHMLYHTEVYSELIDKYMVRHFSKPGITGWAQVTGFRGETKELWQMEERVRRDIWYIENWSFWLDIKIMLMTAVSIIRPDRHAY